MIKPNLKKSSLHACVARIGLSLWIDDMEPTEFIGVSPEFIE
jgi:hypothetical protein